uniref:Uncharacterized protein n=1 Tax=Cajanus cajan TaxID=3821 RepID=A0A151QL25_CAJCA|nr:hypothetical protein KK1_049334 [Cajanus cajan]
MDQKSRHLGKWSNNWEGPFIIDQVYSKNAYVIKEINLNIVSKVINGSIKDQSFESNIEKTRN